MRELKFRAWYKPTKVMLDWNKHRDCILDAIPLDTGDEWTEQHVVMQYTGLKDKNGTEIYEGDIVRYVEKMHEHGDSQVLTATVIYDNDYGAWGLGKEEIHNYFLDFTVVKNSIEIIGNIFDSALSEQQLQDYKNCYSQHKLTGELGAKKEIIIAK